MLNKNLQLFYREMHTLHSAVDITIDIGVLDATCVHACEHLCAQSLCASRTCETACTLLHSAFSLTSQRPCISYTYQTEQQCAILTGHVTCRQYPKLISVHTKRTKHEPCLDSVACKANILDCVCC